MQLKTTHLDTPDLETDTSAARCGFVPAQLEISTAGQDRKCQTKNIHQY